MAKEKGEVVNLHDKVQVKGLKVAKGKQHLEVGKVYDVHPFTAENLVNTKHAEYLDGKAKASKGKTATTDED